MKKLLFLLSFPAIAYCGSLTINQGGTGSLVISQGQPTTAPSSPNYVLSLITGQQDLTSPGYATTGSIWVNSGHTCTITPSSNTAPIELEFDGLFQNTFSSQELLVTIFRDTTNLAAATGGVANSQFTIMATTNTVNEHFSGHAHTIDVPGDTSAHTYTVKLNGAAGVQFTFNGNNVVSAFSCKEIK